MDNYKEIQQISENPWNQTLRIADGNGQKFILKRCKINTSEALDALENEYQLLKDFKLKAMLPLAKKEKDGIYFHDIKVESCIDISQNKALSTLDLIAQALDEVHKNGILLRNLQPRNILIGENQAFINDFSQAVLGEREHPELKIPSLMGGDLHYSAPESSGRLNRPIDYRADYYSLGVILYQLLTGRLPFTAQDPLELIYAHLAIDPVNPQELDSRISSFTALLVMKLLAKEPALRYQSIEGLRADLKIAQDPDKAKTARPGIYDIPQQFNVSHKLYGREKERAILLEAYDRSTKGSRELVLISGYSGIGKTSLIKETYIPITRQKAFFISGKFDQLQKVLPYSAISEALGRLLDFILADPEEVRFWQEKIHTELGENAGVLLALIPRLVLLTGPLKPPNELPPAEASNRFSQSFLRFMGIFRQKRKQLVLFLDDLQWADAASLNLLEMLLKSPDSGNIFTILAYRDNEVYASHPLIILLSRLQREALAPRFSEIILHPLEQPALEQMLADTFASNPKEVAPLVKVMEHRTLGNPFFLWQFLKAMRAKGFIYFDLNNMRWAWSLHEIEKIGFAENVVELMLGRLNELPLETRKLLTWAACLGPSFGLGMLAQASGLSASLVQRNLTPAIREEFILPLTQAQGKSFRFFHDRMQEAAYNSCPPAEIAEKHRQIANILLSLDEDGEKNILEIADHLNLARPLLETAGELWQLAEINLRAARKAKKSTAYEAALSYLRAGMERLAADLWAKAPDFAYELFKERGEIEYLNTNFEAAREFVEAAIEQEGDKIRKAQLFHMLVVQYTLRAMYPKAIATARQGLRLFNIELPEKDYALFRDQELAEIEKLLAGRKFSALNDLPPMQDPEKKAIMLLLIGMGPPCYRSHPWLWGGIVAYEIRLCLEYGYHPGATYSYPALGGLLTHVGKARLEDCQDLASATLNLMEKANSPTDTSVGYLMLGSSLRHWFAPLAQASADYLAAYQTGLNSGNLQYAVYGFGHNTYCRFFQGVNLKELAKETQGYLDFSQKRKNLWGIDLTKGALRVFALLQGTKPQQSEEEYLKECENNHNLQVICIYHILRATALLHLQRHDEAIVSLEEAEKRLDSVSTQGLLPVFQFYFLKALLLPKNSQMGQIRSKFALWAQWAPENFAFAHQLINANVAFREGNWAKAFEAYEEALTLSKKSGTHHNTALIAGMMADFWQKQGKQALAELYFKEALQAYNSWGASAAMALHPLTSNHFYSSEVMKGEIGKIIRIGQMLANNLEPRLVAENLAKEILPLSGAQRAEVFLVGGEAQISDLHSQPIDHKLDLPLSLLRFVVGNGKTLILERKEGKFQPNFFNDDPYFQSNPTENAVAIPLVYLGVVNGLIYLEHKEITGIFAPENILIIEFVAAQAAISLHNSKLYARLQAEITTRREAEGELIRAHNDLRAFADITAHHLQEPSRRLVTFSQRLKKQLLGSKEDFSNKAIPLFVIASLDFIEEEAYRLRNLVRDVQRYLSADISPNDIGICNIDEIIDVLLEEYQARIVASSAIVSKTDLPEIIGSPSRFKEIFRILLDNALNFSRHDSAVKIEITAQQQEGVARFYFQDNGIGIAPEYRERVFRVFERLRPSSHDGKTGIGLSVLRRMIEATNGKIWIEETPGGGTTVVFEVPNK